MANPSNGPLTLPSGDMLRYLYPRSTDLFPHITGETVNAIARFDFPQHKLGTFLRIQRDRIIHHVSKANPHPDPHQHFIEQLPDVFAFVEAWAIFTAILQNERPDLPIAAALNGHMCNILTLSKKSEWRNVVNYHLAFLAMRANDSFFNPQLWISTDPNLLEMYCPPHGLLHLNDDCLHYIIEWLFDLRLSAPFPVKNLSLCCTRIRMACLPFLFAKVSWPLKLGTRVLMKDMVPDRLLSYIREFRLHADTEDSKFIGGLKSAAPKMTRIAAFEIQTKSPPPDALIQALARLPTLRHLTFEETPLIFHPEFSLRFHHLDSITFKFFRGHSSFDTFIGPQSMDSHESPVPVAVWGSALTRMLIDNKATLRRSVVFAPLISFREMSIVPWPHLVSLTMTDYLPSSVRYPDATSIPALVHRMPKLEVLRLLPHRRPRLESSLCHGVTQHLPLESPPTTIRKFESPLRRLTICNLDPDNSLLRDLPWSLQSLAILTACYPNPNQSEWVYECGIKPTHASQILGDISALEFEFVDKIYLRKVPNLRELCMILDKQPSVNLIREVASRFPLLKKLQLGITHFDWDQGRHNADETRQIWARYADAISALVELEEVYLGLPQHVFYYPLRHAANDLPCDLDSFIHVLLKCNPFLKGIGVQLYTRYDEYSGTRADDLCWWARRVDRTQDGAITLSFVTGPDAQRECWDEDDV